MCKKEADLSELIGKTLVNIDIDYERNRIIFLCQDGNVYMMYHEQDCCEDVTIEDVVGDIWNLIGSPLTMAECIKHEHLDGEDESSTSTWYKLATVNGYVTIRWYGESNGYYSEEVYFAKLSLQARIDDNVKSIEFRTFDAIPYKQWQCKDCNFFGGPFCECENEEKDICEEAEITAKHAYFVGKAEGRAETLAEKKKYIIKEDGSIHSLDKDIEDAYNRGRTNAFHEVIAEMCKSPFAGEKVSIAKKYIQEQLKEKENE